MWLALKNKEKVEDTAVSLPQTISLEDQGASASQPIASTEGMSSMASFLPSYLYALVSTLHPQYLYQTMPLYTPYHCSYFILSLS